MSGEPPPKRHKKHKRDRDRDRYDEKFGGGTPTYSSGGPSIGNSRLKLILKVGGSSTPEHSDSPGPAHVLSVPYDEDSRTSSMSYPHTKKSKKKEKKKKKDKKHKHHHKKKRREKEDLLLQEAIMGSSPSPLNLPQTVSPITVIGKGLAENMDTTGDTVGSPSAIAVSKEPRPGILKPQRVVDKVPLQKLLQHLARALEKKDPQQFFAWPVTDKIAPGYSSIITQPMDFSSMKAKVDAAEYSTYIEFVDDFKRMCSNAMTYNHAETVYYKAAKKLLQSGLKILDPSKIRALDPLIPSIRMLSEEQFPFPMFQDPVSQEMGSDMMSQSEEEIQEPICKDPTKSIHYMPPHPNDPPDPCGAFTEDLVMEEVLIQARLAAREAAHRLTTKKPNSKLGFLRQKEDGTTSLAILTSGAGVVPGSKEQPVSLGALTGKITHGTSHLIGTKEEKKANRGPKALNYGPFSSYAPSHDSTFAALSKDESELVEATYGDDTASHYAESIYEFAKGCDYTMRMVDEILNTLTKGEHSRTIELIEERKKLQEEEAQARREQEEYAACLEQEWGFIEMGFPPTVSEVSTEDPSVTAAESDQNVDFEALKSLQDDLGIDTGFVDDLKDKFHNTVNRRLSETAELLGNLERVQNDRLSLPIQSNPPYVLPPSDEETLISDRIQEKLIDLAKLANPGDLVSTAALHKAMGIDFNAHRYRPPSTAATASAASTGSNLGPGGSLPPQEPPNPENANVPMETGDGWSAVTTESSTNPITTSSTA